MRYAAILTLITALFMGCGKAEYEALMKSRMDRLAFASKFLQTLHPNATEVVEQVASLRLPKFIDEDALTYRMGARDRRGDAIDPKRIQPPFLNLPGFQFSYEVFVDLGGRGNTHPSYCYIASVPVKQLSQQALLGRIRADVRRRFKSATWQDVQLDTPDGGKLAFKKLTARGAQDFEMNSDGGEVRQLAGQFDLYVHTSSDMHLIFGFRATDEAAAQTRIFDHAPMALGTLEVEAMVADDRADA